VVNSESFKTIITPDPGGQTDFDFSFSFNLNTDVKVEHWLDGEKADLFYADGDFTVYSADTSLGGTVTTKNSYSSGEIVIYRKPDYKQYIKFLNSMPNRRQVEEIGFDRITMMARYLKDRAQRAIRRNKVDQSDMEMPSLNDRAGHNIGFDANGEPEAIDTLREITPSTIGQNILDAADASEAQDDIGIHDDWDALLDDASKSEARASLGLDADNLSIDDADGYTNKDSQGDINDELIKPFRVYAEAEDSFSAGDPSGFDGQFYSPVTVNFSEVEIVDLEVAASSNLDYATVYATSTDGIRYIYIAYYDSNEGKYYVSGNYMYGTTFGSLGSPIEVATSTSSARPQVCEIGDYIGVLYKDSSDNWKIKVYRGGLADVMLDTEVLTEGSHIVSGITEVSLRSITHDHEFYALTWFDPATNNIWCRVFQGNAVTAKHIGALASTARTNDLMPRAAPLFQRGDDIYFWFTGNSIGIAKYDDAAESFSAYSNLWTIDDLTTEDSTFDFLSTYGGRLYVKPVGGNDERNGFRIYRYNADSNVVGEIIHWDDDLFSDSFGGLVSKDIFAIVPSDGEWIYCFSTHKDRLVPLYQANISDSFGGSRTAIPSSGFAGHNLIAWVSYNGNIVYIHVVNLQEYIGVACENVGSRNSGVIQKRGLVKNLTGLEPGRDYYYDYLSATLKPGPAAGVYVGVALSETELYLK
jgi:hypothetical protein